MGFRSGGSKGRSGALKGGGPKILRFLFPVPPQNSSFLSLSFGLRGILVGFETPGGLKCACLEFLGCRVRTKRKNRAKFWVVRQKESGPGNGGPAKGGPGKGGPGGTEHDQTKTLKQQHTNPHTNTNPYTNTNPHTNTHTNTHKHKSKSVWPKSVWPKSVLVKIGHTTQTQTLAKLGLAKVGHDHGHPGCANSCEEMAVPEVRAIQHGKLLTLPPIPDPTAEYFAQIFFQHMKNK